jgi:hypothetical protein
MVQFTHLTRTSLVICSASDLADSLNTCAIFVCSSVLVYSCYVSCQVSCFMWTPGSVVSTSATA